MVERIYLMSEDGLSPLEEQRFESEEALQELIASHPELIDGEQIRPGDARRWILITREMGIANRWAVDHLIIDQDAIPTLVEVKRGENSQVRREVVGQMMDYAAHWTGTWSINEIRQTFENNEDDPEGALAALLQDDEPDTDAFWDNVATNLSAKRLRLLFLADKIPDELARVVEFLNEQMPRVEVLAVEVKQFTAESSSARTLVPRIIGRLSAKPSRSSGGSRSMTRSSFFEQLSGDDVRQAAEQLLDTARNAGAQLSWSTRGVNIRASHPLSSERVTVAWLFPPSYSWGRVRNFSFGTGTGVANRGTFGSNMKPELERRLREWCDQFKDDTFAQDTSGEGVVAYSVSPDDIVQHIDVLKSRLAKVIEDLASLKAPETP